MSQDVQARALEARIRTKARRRAYSKLGFMWHFAVFLLANLAMIALNEAYTPTVRWFVWPLSGWGVALLFHAFATFSAASLSEDMIRQEIEKEKQRRGLA